MRIQIRYKLFLKRVKETNKDNFKFDFKSKFKTSKLELIVLFSVILLIVYKFQDKKIHREPAGVADKLFLKNYYDYVDPDHY